MKKVVGGRVYDTDAATQVVNWREKLPGPGGIEVEVSVSLNREYVLKAGEKAEDAVSATSYGSMRVDSAKVDERAGRFFLLFQTSGWGNRASRVRPVDDEEARRYVELYGDYDVYCRFFGAPEGLSLTPAALNKCLDEQLSEHCREKRELEQKLERLQARLGDVQV